MESKVCKVCGVDKKLEEFAKNRDSRVNTCKVCCNKQKKLKYATDPQFREDTVARQREYSAANRDKIRLANNLNYEANREVRLEYANNYYYINKDYILDYHKQNRESIRTSGIKYREINKERIAEVNKSWRQANRHSLTQYQTRRQASKKRAIPAWANCVDDQFFVDEIYHLSRVRSEVTGVKYNVDHIVPLISEKVCGLHCSSNLRVIDRLSNISKGNRHWSDMW
jgi:hypothetical protein